MSLSKFNKTTVTWSKSTEGWKDYKKASDLEEGKHYPFYGCFVTPDRGYGEGGVIISDGYFINTPASFIDDIKAIRSDEDSVNLINEGKETFRVEHYESSKFKKMCTRIILD